MTSSSPFRSQLKRIAWSLRLRLVSQALPLAFASWFLGCALWEAGSETLAPSLQRATAYSVLALGSILLALWLCWRASWSLLDVALFLDAKLHTQELLTSALYPQTAGNYAAALERRASAQILALKPRSHLPHWLGANHAWLTAGALLWTSVVNSPLQYRRPEATPLPAIALNSTAMTQIAALADLTDDSPEDPPRSERRERIRALAQQLSEVAASPRASAPRTQAELDELRRLVSEELADTRAQLAPSAGVLEAFKEPALRGAQLALVGRDAPALDRALGEIALSDNATDKEHAREALRQALSARETNRILATLLEQEWRRFTDAEQQQAARRALDTATNKRSAQQPPPEQPLHRESWQRPRVSDAAPMPRIRADKSVAPEHFAENSVPSEIADWLGTSSGAEPANPQTPTAPQQQNTVRLQRELTPTDLARQQQLLQEAARTLDPSPARPDTRAPKSAPPQGGIPGDGVANRDGDRASAGTGGTSTNHHMSPEELPRSTARALVVGVAPQLDLRGGLLRPPPGRVAAAPIDSSTVRPQRTPSAVPIPPEHLLGIDHIDIPTEYREQVRRYFAP